MKQWIFIPIMIFMAAIAFSFHSQSFEQVEPWTVEQLMDPADLAQNLNTIMARKPTIFNIGPSGAIKESISIGATQHDGNVADLRSKLESMNRDAQIVIYCGCCPFDVCPNIRPAFSLLNEMGFKNHKLLNLPENLKVDWIDKGYPME